jgi:hypothetical protein
MSLDENTPSEKSSGLALVAAAFVLALGVGTGIYFVAQALETGFLHPHGTHSVAAFGRATRLVKADQGVWPIRIVATGNDLATLQAKIDADTKTVQDFLKAHGIGDDEIQTGPIQVIDLMARADRCDNAHDNRFVVYGNIRAATGNVDQLYEAGLKSGDLAKAGVLLTDEGAGAPAFLTPSFFLSKEAEVRADLLSQAGRAAHADAEALAHQAGAEIDALLHEEEVNAEAPSAASKGLSGGALAKEGDPMKEVKAIVRSEYALRQ